MAAGRISGNHRACESGVALRLPPQSTTREDWRWFIAFPIVPFSLALFCLAIAAHACGPFFPNNLLSSGDEALLAAPTANFRRELERLNLAPSRFDHMAATNGYAQQTFDAELSDLTAALRNAKLPDEAALLIITAHRKNRDTLQRYRDAHAAWEVTAWMDQDERTAAKRTWSVGQHHHT
jgi:hypothetical protein